MLSFRLHFHHWPSRKLSKHWLSRKLLFDNLEYNRWRKFLQNDISISVLSCRPVTLISPLRSASFLFQRPYHVSTPKPGCSYWHFGSIIYSYTVQFNSSLLWRHDGCDGVSLHQLYDCLLNRSFMCRSKKTSKLRVTGLCSGNSPVTGEFPAQMASNAENVSIWLRHYVSYGPLLRHHHTVTDWMNRWVTDWKKCPVVK